MLDIKGFGGNAGKEEIGLWKGGIRAEVFEDFYTNFPGNWRVHT